MAVMIPEKPRAFDPKSREDLMFYALEHLPDTYYVVHSFQVNKINPDGNVYVGEADFVIFNPKKGMLCIEAKATRARYEQGEWLYGDGSAMEGGGPVAQAKRGMFAIKDYMRNHGMQNLINGCKFFFGVWFPLVPESYVRDMLLPPELPPELVLTEEALDNPEFYLDRIFRFSEHGKTETSINDAQAARIVNEVLCPQFEIAPTPSFDTDTKHMLFHRLLKEQAAILNFLEDQKTAVINGAAGTGKTLVAVEKAKRHANRGEKVLFLCVNRMLKDHLAASYAHPNIDFYTIAGYACSVCRTAEPDYKRLCNILLDQQAEGSFPYQHIVVDEGQDFGMEVIDEADVLETLKMMIEDTKDDRSFFVFYDKLQLVLAKKMPKFLEDVDCKLSLYRNCRNTENIAKASLRPIAERNPKLVDNCIVGVPVKLHFCNDEDDVLCAVDDTLESLLREEIKNIVIMTCKTEDSSCLKKYLEGGKYPAGKVQIRFTTTRKFKGLEADAVILVDVDESTFLGGDGKNVMQYYVGASRARLRLDIITTMDTEGANLVLESLKKGSSKNPQRALARALNTVPVTETAQ